MIKRLPLLLAALFLCIGWTIRELPPLPNGWNVGHAINGSGAVAGQSTNKDGIVRAVWWDAAGVIHEIPTPIVPGHFSHALDINEKNVVVGRMATATSDWHAFKFNSGVLTDLTAAEKSIAFSINNSNDVVGQWTVAGTPPRNYAVKWAGGAPGVPAWLGGFGGLVDFASAISDYNAIAGTSALFGGKRHAALWRSGTIIDLGTVGGEHSYGRALTARESDALVYVVGDSEFTFGSMDTHAFLYSLGTHTMIDIGTLPGCSWTQANGINKMKRVVGSCQGFGYSHAWLWDGGTMVDLESLISPAEGWTLQGANDINENGQIVGYGTHFGKGRAFIMTP